MIKTLRLKRRDGLRAFSSIGDTMQAFIVKAGSPERAVYKAKFVDKYEEEREYEDEKGDHFIEVVRKFTIKRGKKVGETFLPKSIK